MKFLVVLCLFALATAEEDTQEQSQSTENTPTGKPALTPTQSTATFNSQVFPPSTLSFGNKDSFASVAFPGFTGTFPSLQTVGPDFFTAGSVNGGVPQFSQVPRTVVPTTSGLASNIQSGFGVPNTALPSVPSVVGGLGNQFAGLPTTRVLSGINGYQGVPVGGVIGNPTFGGLPQITTSPYRLVTQDGLAGFPHHHGLQSQTVTGTTGVPVFTGGVLSPLASGVFPATQGVLKSPVTGTTTLNVPNYTTGNVPSVSVPSVSVPSVSVPSVSVPSEQTGNVFRRS